MRMIYLDAPLCEALVCKPKPMCGVVTIPCLSPYSCRFEVLSSLYSAHMNNTGCSGVLVSLRETELGWQDFSTLFCTPAEANLQRLIDGRRVLVSRWDADINFVHLG